ncbi:unnamed protein product [Pedinophyceae sp. YPF-701]|nr:unnamed protein product [Pedinophyceae sp. YPF-701]
MEEAAGVESHEDAGESEIFAPYRCRTAASRGRPHPADVSEPAALAAVQLPRSRYDLFDALPAPVVERGLLSDLQLEGVLYACDRHRTIMPDGTRAGFFLGDGAGVGKGRQIAGMVLDNFARGRRKAVWVSTTIDLVNDAVRDLRDIGCHGVSVIPGPQALDGGGARRPSRGGAHTTSLSTGVMFTTYTTLVTVARGAARLDQVVAWAGGEEFEGLLVFDECHKAKNAGTPANDGASVVDHGGSKVAAAVIELQRRMPRARVVYCSATGVSEVAHTGYMERMGLWGAGTAFANHAAFCQALSRGGVGYLELLATELKAQGRYVSRGLSFAGAEWSEIVCDMDAAMVAQYDAIVRVVQRVRAGLSKALALCHGRGARGSAAGHAWRTFWSLTQRVFRAACVASKLPAAIAAARAAVAADQCVIVGIQSTGEFAVDSTPDTARSHPAFVSPVAAMMEQFVQAHFPTEVQEADADDAGGPPRTVVLAEAERVRSRVLAVIHGAASDGVLPPNSLDALIDALGGPTAVAEMTGRRVRMVRGKDGAVRYQMRVTSAAAPSADSVNIAEARAFNEGRKRVAIISDAASTGISLHARRGSGNERRRVHLTLELPWSADRAIQQLGRSHRSDQASCPAYRLLVLPLGGESRFVAAVARRLESLGALTRGDRRAASGLDLSGSNFDSRAGRAAFARLLKHVGEGLPHLPHGVSLEEVLAEADEVTLDDVRSAAEANRLAAESAMSSGAGGRAGSTLADEKRCTVRALHAALKELLGRAGLLEAEDAGGKEDNANVKRFLNRLLTLPVASQNLVFRYFSLAVDGEIGLARMEGRHTSGMSTLAFSSAERVGPPREVFRFGGSSLPLTAHDLIIDRGMTWQQATERLQAEVGEAGLAGGPPSAPADGSAPPGFYVTRDKWYGHHCVVLALPRAGSSAAGPARASGGGTLRILRPWAGSASGGLSPGDLLAKHAPIEPSAARALWEAEHERSAERCSHGLRCAQPAGACTTGKRRLECCVLSGSVVRVWSVLETVLERHKSQVPRTERALRAVRVPLGGPDGKVLVGVRYPGALLKHVSAALNFAPAAGAQAVGDDAACDALVEPPTPVDGKSRDKALRKPLGIQDFFSRQMRGSKGEDDVAAQPTSAPAPREICISSDDDDVDDDEPAVEMQQIANCGVEEGPGGADGQHVGEPAAKRLRASGADGARGPGGESADVPPHDGEGLRQRQDGGVRGVLDEVNGGAQSGADGGMEQLVAMGFSQADAWKALRVGKSVEGAISWLLG